jgi:hypothetical protein
MQIKAADDRSADIKVLEAFLERPDLTVATRQRVEQEIRSMRAGVVGERGAAYEIEFYFGKSQNYATIHDLRIEHDGRVAQIDHLIINRVLQIWVCESKHFVDSVSINDLGEWERSYRGNKYGVPSPVEQNKKHIDVLGKLFKSGVVSLPRRVLTMRPELLSLILVSNNAIIKRPRKKVDGLDSVIKAERLKTRVDDTWDDGIGTAVRRLVSTGTIERLARDLAALHRPKSVNWAAKFGLEPIAPDPPSLPMASKRATPAVRGAPSDPSGILCGRCGGPTSYAEVAFCRYNKPRFAGGLYCRTCQTIVAPIRPRA